MPELKSRKRKLAQQAAPLRKKHRVLKADDLPWKTVSRPVNTGLDGDDGILELEEVDDVEVVYEDTDGGRVARFKVCVHPTVVLRLEQGAHVFVPSQVLDQGSGKAGEEGVAEGDDDDVQMLGGEFRGIQVEQEEEKPVLVTLPEFDRKWSTFVCVLCI